MATTQIYAYVHGSDISLDRAKAYFTKHHQQGGGDPDEIPTMWEQCLQSEEARDNWLPSYLELVVSA